MNRKRHCPSCKCAELEAVPEPPPVDGARWIRLTKGHFALVDEADYDEVNRWSWYSRPAPHGNYAAHWGVIPGHRNRAKNIFLHHFLMGVRQRVDHINGNGLDNRRANLRLCTHAQNMMNRRKFKNSTSKYKGVSIWKNKRGEASGWTVNLYANRKQVHLGIFSDEIEAARAYDTAAKKHFGEFARLNFPDEPTNILRTA